MSEIRTAAEALEAAAEVGKEAAKTGDCHHVAASIRALASRIPPAADDEALVERCAHAAFVAFGLDDGFNWHDHTRTYRARVVADMLAALAETAPAGTEGGE